MTEVKTLATAKKKQTKNLQLKHTVDCLYFYFYQQDTHTTQGRGLLKDCKKGLCSQGLTQPRLHDVHM